MKLLALELKSAGYMARLAYYHAHGTREGCPLLDELGAAIDHIEAFSTGGACTEENFCTACWKCNVRKSSDPIGRWEQRKKRKPIKGKYGEPECWDGLTSVFILLAERHFTALTSGDKQWVKALKIQTDNLH